MPMTAALLALHLLLPAGHFTAYFTSGFSDAAYQKVVVEKVSKAWHAPAGAPVGKKTVLRTEIAKDGSIAKITDHMMTGFAPWDDAAVAALKRAAPFPPLPKSWSYPTMEVDFHFEVVPKGK